MCMCMISTSTSTSISISNSLYLYHLYKKRAVSVSKGLKPEYCVSLDITVIRMVTCSRGTRQHKELRNLY